MWQRLTRLHLDVRVSFRPRRGCYLRIVHREYFKETGYEENCRCRCRHGDVADGAHGPLAVAYAQILGVVWSAAKGLNVDNPFDGQGTLTRVVSGVKLYPVSA